MTRSAWLRADTKLSRLSSPNIFICTIHSPHILFIRTVEFLSFTHSKFINDTSNNMLDNPTYC